MPESGGDEDDESADELWEPSERPGWFVRWRSGWRLALILAVIVGGYAGWRGQRDYQSFKSWRARSMAEEALRLANDHNAAGAQELLDRAAVLDPKDPEVMRAIVKFCEPRQDFMALYALRQLILTGAAEPEEWELLCRLSFEWGRPELAPPTLLSAWATSAVESLTPGQVLLSCQWLAGRGRLADAEKRLREKVAAGGPGQAKLRIALSNILLGSMEGNSDELKHRAEEGLTTLRQVSTDANVPPAERADAARMLASYLLLPANRGMLRGEAASLLIQTFKSLAVAEPASALKHDLAAASVSLAADPSTGGKILEELLRRASSLPLPDRLTLGRWMVDQRMLQEMLILAATLPESETDDDWVKLRLDALLALNKHDDVSALLAANGSPLPPLTREVYRYRLAKKLKTAAKPDEVLQTARDGAQPKVVMDAARAMEGMQEYDAAAQLYRAVQNDERVGLSAKLAIVRCLSALPSDDAGPLIEALDSVLRAWPQMDDARNDMIYLKLVANTATPEEMRDAGLLAKNYPWMLAYRVTAALAEFRNNNAPGALALLEQEKLPWDRVPPGWQSIYGVLLAANHRIDEARAIGVRIMGAKLRTGEAKLLRQYLPDSP